MSTNMESSNLLYQKHKELCLSLNMDNKSEEKSWESFQEIRNNYALDVSSFLKFLIVQANVIFICAKNTARELKYFMNIILIQ